MRIFSRPQIVIPKPLSELSTSSDPSFIDLEFAEKLQPYVDFIIEDLGVTAAGADHTGHEHIPVSGPEGRLSSAIREQYLIRIFMISDFLKVAQSGKFKELVEFHKANKYLLMAISQKQLSILGKIVAHGRGKDMGEILSAYRLELDQALNAPLEIGRNINALLHVFGYFKKKLSNEEKSFYLEQIEAYQVGEISLHHVLKPLRLWTLQFDLSYLREQTLLEPFPEELFEVLN